MKIKNTVKLFVFSATTLVVILFVCYSILSILGGENKTDSNEIFETVGETDEIIRYSEEERAEYISDKGVDPNTGKRVARIDVQTLEFNNSVILNTYVNTKYGYSFDYPEEYSVYSDLIPLEGYECKVINSLQSDRTVSVVWPPCKSLHVSMPNLKVDILHSYIEEKDFENWFNENITYGHNLIISREYIGIGESLAYQVLSEFEMGSAGSHLLVNNHGETIHLRYDGEADDFYYSAIAKSFRLNK